MVSLLIKPVNEQLLEKKYGQKRLLSNEYSTIQFEFRILSVFGQYSAKDESFLSSYSTFFLPCESFG